MRVLIAAGGTGGHVIPALQVARELKRRGAEMLFVGTARGLEARLVPENGFRMVTIEVGGLNRVGASQMLATLFQLPGAMVKSARIIEEFRPDVAFGVGAYISGPVLLIAAMKGVPVVVHEANAVPGFTNRLLAPWVTRALVGTSDALRFFPSRRAEVTGLPVAEEFFHIPPRKHAPPFTVLVTGGSRGSARLNRAVREALPMFAFRRDLFLIHQTGEGEYEAMKQVWEKQGVQGDVAPFLKDMAGAMARADLVVCRSGASTLAELAAAGKASLLVPFPHASNDHQLHNALSRERAGAARVVRDSELDGARLFRELLEMLGHLEQMEENVRRFAEPQAAERIVRALETASSA